MSSTDRDRVVADAAWEAMRLHAIPATPRNYEIWYSVCAAENPALNERIEILLQRGETVTPSLLESLYREFFASPVDAEALDQRSTELQNLATEMADRVSTDRRLIAGLGQAFGSCAASLRPTPKADELRRAAATLGSASAQASERLQALEQLFTASVARIDYLKVKLAEAQHEATRDALTGLANRRMFDAALARAIRHAQVEGGKLALMMLDIDHFKQFNDTHGHLLGDGALRLVASVLTSHIKGRDTAARYGGEEFAIILPGADLAGAVSLGDQIRLALERRPVLNRASGQRLGAITCSIGVAQYRSEEPAGELVARADRSLYRAKADGRNVVRTEEWIATTSAV
jgi:diguanylate cyclase